MNGHGMIFTPIDDPIAAWESKKSRTGPAAPTQSFQPFPTVQQAPDPDVETPQVSGSLLDFCSALGERHDPNQFGTSVEGGCWAGSGGSPSPLVGRHRRTGSMGSEKEKRGVPIHRVDHKMNTDGLIFTPSQTPVLQPLVGSLGSDSDIGSYTRSPPIGLHENKSLFLASAAAAVATATMHPGLTPPPPPTWSENATLSEILASVPEPGEPEPLSGPTESTPPVMTVVDERVLSEILAAAADEPLTQSTSTEHQSDDEAEKVCLPARAIDIRSSGTDGAISAASSSHSSPTSTADTPTWGRPRWLKDHECDACPTCQKRFGMFLRRHHCRNCGGIFCKSCSSAQMHLPHLGYTAPCRVCDKCAATPT